MILTYFLFVHSDLHRVKALINRLKASDVNFYVHIDAKCPEDTSILSNLPDVTVNDNRINVKWGHISMVYALISSLNDIICRCKSDYVILLSGEDYPVKSNEYIREYIGEHGCFDHIHGKRIPSEACSDPEGGIRRLQCFALHLGGKYIATVEPRRWSYGNLRQLLKTMIKAPAKTAAFARLFCSSKRRRHPDYLTPYVGEMWWGLRISTIKTVMAYVSSHSDYIEYLQDSNNPDEMFMPSLVYSLIPANDIKNDCLRFINWGGSSGKSNSPAAFTPNDRKLLAEIVSDKQFLFARKFTSTAVTALVDEITAG